VKFIRNAILRWARSREPDFVIGGPVAPYLRRHWLIPRNPLFNIYVHEFLRSDDDRALHDHPWLFNCSILLEGQYLEWVPTAGAKPSYQCPVFFPRRQGDVKFRWGRAAHRIQLFKAPPHGEKPCWTVFITGPRVRKWGFYCPRGWVHWKQFTAGSDPGAVGRGCE
jgi:hypothetical protein